MSAADIVVRLAVEADRSRWNEFLLRREASSPFALFEWRDVLAASYGPTMRFWIAERADEVVGVLPTFVSKNRSRPILYSMRQGLVAADDRIASALLAAAKQEAENLGCRGTVLTSGLIFHKTPYRCERKKTVTIDLSEGEAGLWKSLRRKTRPIVRKGEKYGLVADWDSGDIDAFYDIYANDIAGKGVPILDRHFFRVVVEKLAPHVRVLIVRHGDQILSGGIVFMTGKFATFVYQGTAPGTRDFAPSTFMFWEIAKRCIAEGVATLDLGESREGSSVFQFKINFGGTPRDLAYYDLNSAFEAVNADLVSPPDQAPQQRSLRERLVMMMPLVVKRQLAEIARARGRIV